MKFLENLRDWNLGNQLNRQTYEQLSDALFIELTVFLDRLDSDFYPFIEQEIEECLLSRLPLKRD